MEITTQDIIDEYKNEYKQKLVNYIRKEQQKYEGTEIDLVLDILLQKINNGVFDNE